MGGENEKFNYLKIIRCEKALKGKSLWVFAIHVIKETK
jgi:hypothetical protein